MKLSIAEGLYLIAMDDEHGKLLTAAEKTLIPGLLSAIIFELHLLGKLELTNNEVRVKDQSGTDNPILDNVLRRITSGEIVAVINRLAADMADLNKALDNLLQERGILKREATKLLWIPLSERMENANYAYEEEIRKSLQIMVFKSAKPTASFAILMALIHDCRLLDEVFPDKDDLIDAVKVAEKIVDSPVLSAELSSALKVTRAHLISLDKN